VIELSFNADLYDGAALVSAAEVYARVASCTVVPGTEYHQVLLTATGSVAEGRIADEFGNYALGVTIERRKRREHPPAVEASGRTQP
jgi:hypothetical protein